MKMTSKHPKLISNHSKSYYYYYYKCLSEKLTRICSVTTTTMMMMFQRAYIDVAFIVVVAWLLHRIHNTRIHRHTLTRKIFHKIFLKWQIIISFPLYFQCLFRDFDSIYSVICILNFSMFRASFAKH